jgi:hypothetical protein
MTSPRSELPDDLKSCHALLEQLQAELRAATERTAKLQTAADETQDDSEHVAHLEALLAKYQETIADQQQTIENLAADNALLKRSLFGCRRERFTDDPAQTLLFDPTSDSPEPDDEDEQPKKKEKRTSKGRQPRVFPEFLPREEQKHYLNPEDILGRSGFRIDRSTQWRWMRGLARDVTPLVDLMWDLTRHSAVLGMDETPVMELGGPGRTLKGYLWTGVGDKDHPYDCFF